MLENVSMKTKLAVSFTIFAILNALYNLIFSYSQFLIVNSLFISAAVILVSKNVFTSLHDVFPRDSFKSGIIAGLGIGAIIQSLSNIKFGLEYIHTYVITIFIFIITTKLILAWLYGVINEK